MKKKITIVLDRLRSAHNTGNIFRLAEAVGADIIGCGYTPLPPHPKLAKTAMGTDVKVTSSHCADSLEAVGFLKQSGCRMVLAVDNIPGAKEAWEADYEFPLGLLFGNEALGIDPEAAAACDGAVKLPMFGEKSSINVGNAAAAVLYAVLAKDKDPQK